MVTRTFSGASTRVLVALPDGVEVRVDVASAASGDLTPGTAVTVHPGGAAGARGAARADAGIGAEARAGA